MAGINFQFPNTNFVLSSSSVIDTDVSSAACKSVDDRVEEFKTAVAHVTTTTTTTILGERETKVTTVVKSSNVAALFLFEFWRFQVKAKSFASFFQIAVNIAFNCVILFPPIFDAVLQNLVIFNFEVIPSLGP